MRYVNVVLRLIEYDNLGLSSFYRLMLPSGVDYELTCPNDSTLSYYLRRLKVGSEFEVSELVSKDNIEVSQITVNGIKYRF